MVIEDTTGQVPRLVQVCDIPQGQVFTGTISDYSDSVFLKSYSSVISLSDPMHEWSGHTTLKVSNYIPRDAKVVLL